MTDDTKYLYGDKIGRVELINHWGTDKMVVNAARVSFGQDSDKPLVAKDIKLIKYLIKHRHTSTLEHCGVTFKFTVPLYVRSQHHRHRTWSYNEISRRYTSEDIRFYEPKAFRTQHKSNRQASNEAELINPGWAPHTAFVLTDRISEHHEDCLELYEGCLKLGMCREQARGVLPQNMYTQYYGTVNMNNLMKFISLRTHEGAQWEIQKVAEACLDFARELWPETINAYDEVHNES
jgi:thymidylate synthase (FAD)